MNIQADTKLENFYNNKIENKNNKINFTKFDHGTWYTPSLKCIYIIDYIYKKGNSWNHRNYIPKYGSKYDVGF